MMKSEKKAIEEIIMPTGGLYNKFRYSMFTEKRDNNRLNDQIVEYARLLNKEKIIEQKRSG